MKQQVMTKMYKLIENLEIGDLKRLVHNELHIDEFKSKMGDDADVCVVSFKVAGKEPASDLVSFIEKGYDWVLDADVSSGEKDGGDYIVFVECEREAALPSRLFELMSDLVNLTDQAILDWRVRYFKSTKEHNLSVEILSQIIPLSPEKYRAKYEKDTEEDAEQSRKLDQLKTAAGVNVTTTAPINEFTESLRRAAGLK
jgi:hypothetical protein